MRYKWLVFIVSICVLGGVPLPAKAASATASLLLSPLSASLQTGAQLTVDVVVNTGGQAVSAETVILTMNNLTYVSADTATSDFSVEVTAPTVNGSSLKLSRARFDTGYNGAAGEVVKLTFKAGSTPGTASLVFDQANSQVIAYSDSTNILNGVNNGSYTLTAAASNTPTPTPTSKPKTTPTPTPKKSPTPSPSAVAQTTASPSPSSSASASANATPTSAPTLIPILSIGASTPVKPGITHALGIALVVLSGITMLTTLGLLIRHLRGR